jgi:hypothetical protein
MGVLGTKFGWSNNEIVKRSFYPFLLLFYFFIFYIILYIFHLNPKVINDIASVWFFADENPRSEILNKDTSFCLLLYICRMYGSF